jgi:large subunit ribosomal protein L4
MKLDVKNQKNEVIEQIELNDSIFNVKFNPDTVHQVYTSMLSNRRQPLACTKDRSEVSGGGKKPWRQKGTGRARVGSNRSPLWRHGGVTFGPRQNEANFKRAINKKMKQKALAMILSAKIKDNELVIIDKIDLKEDKTKEMNNVMSNFVDIKKKNNSLAYIIVDNSNKSIIRSSRNIPFIFTTVDNSIDLVTLLNYKYVIILKDSIENISKTFKKD